ncbi:hypothetical protein IJ531_01860, partial [bacterium]|nr:hypothetical protein [bacterium]
MNFSEIKSGFIEYLQNKQIEEGKGFEEISEENFNLFSHFSDFKKYLVEENIADSSIFTKSIKDIEKMQLVDGKLTENAEDKSKDNDLMTDLLNELFSDDEMISTLDKDESGDLDIDEITEFLANSDTDENGEISLENLEEPVQCIYMLSAIYDDNDSIQYLDMNNDGEIDEDEKARFEAFVKG